DRVAAACRAGLDAGADPVAFTRGLALASRDADELGRWLADGRTDHDVALDPHLRWRVVQRLALLGALDADMIDDERRRDGTADADLGAATALAARPSAEAKEEAWAALRAEDVSNRLFTAITRGLWPAEHAALAAPYLPRYLEEGPRWAERGPAFSQVVGHGFPAFHLDEAQLDQLREALAGDVPTVLRRHWQDVLDDRS
ncbi:MAG TPA: ERAP1-like C-terminal domain-containing protein, partial [Nocardioides sp.]|nr:ERAP1-like C-terminal domain-containing protein [Nocardioides sp.]